MTRTITALAAIVLFAATGAEAQTGEWEINKETDEWGDPDPNGDTYVHQRAEGSLTIRG